MAAETYYQHRGLLQGHLFLAKLPTCSSFQKCVASGQTMHPNQTDHSMVRSDTENLGRGNSSRFQKSPRFALAEVSLTKLPLAKWGSSLIWCFGFYGPAEPVWLIRTPPGHRTCVNSCHTFHLLQSQPKNNKKKGHFKRKVTSISFKDAKNQQQNNNLNSQPTSNRP